MNALFLLPAEREAFQKLSASLQEGWQLHDETIVYEDTPAKRRIRFAQAHVQSPELKALLAGFVSTQTVYNRNKALEDFDWQSVPNADVQEVLYALGPELLGSMIQYGLTTAETDEDVLQIAAYSSARHLFYGSA